MTEQTCRLTVFFDGSCPLCNAEIGSYQRDDTNSALTFVDVRAPDADVPAYLDRNSGIARFHVLADSGELLSGAAAFAAIWRKLPRWRRLAQIAAIPGMLAILEVGYSVFLRARPLFVGTFVLVRRLLSPS